MKSPWSELLEDLERGVAPARSAWQAFAIIVLLILALAMALHFIAKNAHAQPVRHEQAPFLIAQDAPRVIFDCQQFGAYARRIVMLRELGAERDKVIRQLREELRPGMMLAVLEREVRRVYANKPSRLEAEADAYKRCQRQLGDMGEEG